MHDGSEKKGSFTKAELLQRICVSMGGRAAELVYYGKDCGMTTGPSGDLENATAIARNMVCRYGMYEEVTNGSISQNTNDPAILEAVNRCINTILQEELNRAIKIVEKNRHVMDVLSEALIKKTYLNKDQMEEVFNNHKLQAL